MKIIISVVLLSAFLTGIYFLFFSKNAIVKRQNKKFDALDIFDDAKAKDFYNKIKNEKEIKLASVTEIQNLSKSIYDAKGIFNDDENAVYNAFSKIPYQSYVAQISVAFRNLYNTSLLVYLKSFLNDDELNKVAKLVNNMDAGYPKIKVKNVLKRKKKYRNV